MIPTSEVALLLRGWKDSKRRLRVIAVLGDVHFSGYCKVFEVDEQGFSMIVGTDPRDMIGFFFEGWSFDFGDAPPGSREELLPGGVIESAIVGLNRGWKLMLLLLRDEE